MPTLVASASKVRAGSIEMATNSSLIAAYALMIVITSTIAIGPRLQRCPSSLVLTLRPSEQRMRTWQRRLT